MKIIVKGLVSLSVALTLTQVRASEKIEDFQGEQGTNHSLFAMRQRLKQPVKELRLSQCKEITDLSSLAGLKIEKVYFEQCDNICDFSSLRQVKYLTKVSFNQMAVSEDEIRRLSQLIPYCEFINFSSKQNNHYAYYRGYKWQGGVSFQVDPCIVGTNQDGETFEQWKQHLDSQLDDKLLPELVNVAVGLFLLTWWLGE